MRACVALSSPLERPSNVADDNDDAAVGSWAVVGIAASRVGWLAAVGWAVAGIWAAAHPVSSSISMRNGATSQCSGRLAGECWRKIDMVIAPDTAAFRQLHDTPPEGYDRQT